MKTQRSSLILSITVLLAYAANVTAKMTGRLLVLADGSNSPKALREQRGEIEDKIDVIVDFAESEKRPCNDEEKAKIKAMMADCKALKERYELIEARAEVKAELDEVEREAKDIKKHIDPLGKEKVVSNEKKELALRGWFLNQVSTFADYVTDEHRAAAREAKVDLNAKNLNFQLLRGLQAKDLVHRFRNTGMTTITGPDGGYLAPPTQLVQSMEVAKMLSGGLMQVVDTMRTTDASPRKWLTFSDVGNKGHRVGQKKTAGTAANPDLNNQMWYAYKYTSGVMRLTHEVLRDAMIDLWSVMGQAFGVRIGRIQNEEYTIGNSPNCPRGLLKRVAVGKTTASSTAIIPDELIQMVHSIDPAYRMGGCSWLCTDDFVLAVRLLKDADGQYIFRAGLDGGAPDRLFTYPININTDHQAMTAGLIPCTFGDHSYYKSREVGTLRIARGAPDIDTDEELFAAYLEADGDLLDPSNGYSSGKLCPVKALKMKP